MTELRVGSRLQTAADFDALPLGTVIGPNSRDTYTKDEHGYRYRSGEIVGLDSFNLKGHNKILSFPDGAKRLVTYESLAQWQWRFRDNAYASADQAGVGSALVTAVMKRLGTTDDKFPLGAGVTITSEYDKGRLPMDTLARWGNPEQVDRFGLFVKRGGGWELLLGERAYSYQMPITLVSGEAPAWATTPGTEAEQEDLVNFKAKAWRAGWRVKREHRWCETYEHYMARVGLDDSVLDAATYKGFSVGDRVSPANAAGLPVNSVLRWHNSIDPNIFGWYIRDDSAEGVAKTRLLFTNTESTRNYRSSMEILYIAEEGEEMSVRVDLDPVWEHVPPGTRLEVGGSHYVVAEDHLIEGRQRENTVPAVGRWRLADLGGGYRIVGFPS